MGPADGKGHQEPGLGVVRIDDDRLGFLADRYKPKKVTPVHVEYLDIAGFTGEGKPGREIGDRVLAHVRPVDALIHCIRFFDSGALGPAEPLKDLERVEEEIILADLSVVEKRIERINSDMRKGRKELAPELDLLERAHSILDEGKPLRFLPDAADSEMLRGFAFLSAKPELFLLNSGENRKPADVQLALDMLKARVADQPHVAFDWLYADTEAEIARLSPEEAKEFLDELGLSTPAKDRIVKASFGLLRLIAFFTVSEKEVRVWPLGRGKSALDAAGTVHSDMQRGFIRAEVIAFDDFKAAGSMPQAHKVGKVRLEGKDYRVNEGDIIFFRFNV